MTALRQILFDGHLTAMEGFYLRVIQNAPAPQRAILHQRIFALRMMRSRPPRDLPIIAHLAQRPAAKSVLFRLRFGGVQ